MLHLLLQEDRLLGLRDDVLGAVGSAEHLQELTWRAVVGAGARKTHEGLFSSTVSERNRCRPA